MELATEHDRHEIYLISSFTAANLIKTLGCSLGDSLRERCRSNYSEKFFQISVGRPWIQKRHLPPRWLCACAHFVWWRTLMQGHICCASMRARRAQRWHWMPREENRRVRHWRQGGGGGRWGSGPRAYKVRSGRGGNSQPSHQVKGGHQLQVRGARTQTSCHASVRAPPLPSGTPRSLLRLLHPELPPRREASAAGDRDQTGLEKMTD